MAAPQIISVVPAPSAKGIILSERITVTFDQEMDESTINDGTFVLLGPDHSTVFSPVDITPFDVAGFEEENNVNASPYVTGYIKGTVSFEKVNASGGTVDDSVKDYTGTGTEWLTLAIFTPDSPLEPNKDYTAFLAGDETPSDAFDSGIKTRTVFDTLKTAGSGTGVLEYYGGYIGSNTRGYTVNFTSGGAVGTALYEWWNNNDPLTVYQGVSSTGERELEDGIFVTCEPDGTFAIGDKFTVVVKPAVVLEDNYRWNFTTGSGNVQTPPSTSSATGIESLTATDTTAFAVSSITPVSGEYGFTISTDPYVGEEIIITFSEALDTATVTSSSIEIYAESANGDPALLATTQLDYSAVAAGNTITIELDPGQLYVNSIVVITLDSTIANTDGDTLGTDYISYFSTPYTPLYTSMRRIQLDLGNLVANIPEETIMLAILEASLAADVMSFAGITTGEFYLFARREYTTCLAELILVRGLLGDSSISDRMTKTLGDLSVSRGGLGLKDRRDKLEDCVAYWQVPLTTGGEITPGASLLPQNAVKGSTAEDRIQVSRQWEPTSGVGVNSRSSANDSVYSSGRRRSRTFRKR